ncbi:MAG: flagellar biosynthesis anti-sigma factor FlgM [Gammaproteobacteria bacterium]|nr:flagellar biosynthesis anti-sigma factor FlgM [Gammaproteobacteria bacterium]
MSNRIVPVDHGMLGKVNNKPGKASTTEVAGAPAPSVQKPAQSESSASDTVELTGSGKLLAQAEETLAAIPTIDSAKVADVRQSIKDGDYVIDAEKITDALLRSDLELSK